MMQIHLRDTPAFNDSSLRPRFKPRTLHILVTDIFSGDKRAGRFFERILCRVRNFTRPLEYIEYFINERRGLNSKGAQCFARTFLPLGSRRTSRLHSFGYARAKGPREDQDSLLPSVIARTIRMPGAKRDITSRTCHAVAMAFTSSRCECRGYSAEISVFKGPF